MERKNLPDSELENSTLKSIENENKYFQKIFSNDGTGYGLKFATPEYAEKIRDIFIEIYSYNYGYPFVYDIEDLKKNIKQDNHYWFIGETLDGEREIFGAALVIRGKYSAYASRAVVKKKFQGLGLATKLGAGGLITIIKRHEFKNVIRLNSDVKAGSIQSQKLLEKTGAVGYGFIPSMINFTNKIDFDPSLGKPFIGGTIESAVLYSVYKSSFWKIRKKEIYLPKNEDILFFYDHIKKKYPKMKNDNLIIQEKGDVSRNRYKLTKDYYLGSIHIKGYIREKELEKRVKEFNKWRLIEWRIPTTLEGINSMKIGVKKGFNAVGYDIGSYRNDDGKFGDSIVMCYFPIGVYFGQFKTLAPTNANKIIIKRVIESIKNNQYL